MKDPNLLIEKRRQEILDAFFKLYETRVFGDIHIKAISEETSFTRATIYNYFKNMDEIFLCAYQGEYVCWTPTDAAPFHRGFPRARSALPPRTGF